MKTSGVKNDQGATGTSLIGNLPGASALKERTVLKSEVFIHEGKEVEGYVRDGLDGCALELSVYPAHAEREEVGATIAPLFTVEGNLGKVFGEMAALGQWDIRKWTGAGNTSPY